MSYLALVDYPKGIKDKIADSLREKLNSGYQLEINDIINDVKFFCEIFPKGEVLVNFNESQGQTFKRKLELGQPKKIYKEKEDFIKKGLLNRLKQDLLDGFSFSRSKFEFLVDNTSGLIHNSYYDSIILTQDIESVSQKRIEYYKNLISSGKRPYCLVYASDINSEGSGYHHYYLIDGHHKIIAYKELGISPSIIELLQLRNSFVDQIIPIDHFASDLIDYLYDWQLEYIIRNLCFEPYLGMIKKHNYLKKFYYE